jgi:hypothetical protein
MLDTYGFFSGCDCCVYYALEHMENKPWTAAGLAEAKQDFGDLWEKYREDFSYYAKVMKRKMEN